MKCKDSDVFALESSIEKILNNGSWKGINEIGSELSTSGENSYKRWLTRNTQQFNTEQSEEIFYEELMDRMCNLFPMKYKKRKEMDNSTVKYARTMGHND